MTSRQSPGPTPVEVLTALLGEAQERSVPARPRPGVGSTPRRPPPAEPPLAVVRALAGAAFSVCAVALGLAVLMWLDPAPEGVSAVTSPAAVTAPSALPSAAPSVAPSAAPSPAPSAAPSAAPSPATSAEPTPAPSAPPAPAAAPASPVPSVAPPSPLVVPVTVLNNSRRSKLAARSAARFAAAGWPVAATGNFRGRIPVTTVYYDPGLEASARAFAARFEGVVRVRPRFATLPARGVVVVLTREFAA